MSKLKDNEQVILNLLLLSLSLLSQILRLQKDGFS